MVAFFIGKEGVGFEPGKRVRLPAQSKLKYIGKLKAYGYQYK